MYEALAESLNYYAESYHAKVFGYVLLPTHLHLIVMINGGLLGSFMRDFKKFRHRVLFAKKKIRQSNVWLSQYDRVAIIDRRMLVVKLEYIHNNPVKAGLVAGPKDWPWSSASNYLTDRVGSVHISKEW